MVSKNEDVSVLIETNPKLQSISLLSAIKSIILVIVVCGVCWWAIHEAMKNFPDIGTREQWIFQRKIYEPGTPADQVIITATGEANCNTQLQCLYVIRLLNLKLSNDDTYNFLLGGDGTVYERYGWKSSDINGGSIVIGFIGTYIDSVPTQKQFDALNTLLEEGVRFHKLAVDYEIYPALELSTLNPSNDIINVINTWPHYLGSRQYIASSNLQEPVTLTTNLINYKLIIIINVIGIGLLLISLVVGMHFGCRFGASKYIETSVNDTTSPPAVNKLHLVTRDEWMAQPPNNPSTPLILPLNRVIITHTETEECDTQAQCVVRVRMLQTFHMGSRMWHDIGYNFLVGSDGAVYEGRGWENQGAHSRGYNAGSIGIAVIGKFTIHPPPQKLFNALKLLLEDGVGLGKLTTDYKMYPHRTFFGTESPGGKVIEILKTWPHYYDKL